MRRAGSPGRRGFSMTVIFLPVTFSQVAMISRTLVPPPVPRLYYALCCAPEGEHVRLREIEDVDVVADARAVGRLVVGAVDFDVLLLPERDLQDVRDEVRLDAVIFAEGLGGAGGVEVAQGDVVEAVDFVIPAEDFLEDQLRFAVRD